MIDIIIKKGTNPKTHEPVYFPIRKKCEVETIADLAETMSRGSTFSVGECVGIFTDIPHYIIDSLLNGNEVHIEGFGTFKLKVEGPAQKDKHDIHSRNFRVSLVFEPEEFLAKLIQRKSEFNIVELAKSKEKK